MALSQKHSGKILVPWFNSTEWRHVYSLIYSDDSNIFHKRDAVKILQVWKARMPILFAGLEGTLIILNAMIIDENAFSEDSLSSSYGYAIMRFLNLCAANSDQQGTFSRVAKERNLPDWLVNIRHDVAHSQKPLSLFMLKEGIKYCFQWLRREYWEIQDNKMKDFEIPTVLFEDDEKELKIYCEYVVATIDQGNFSPEILNMLNEMKLSKKHNVTNVLKKLVKLKKFNYTNFQKIPDLVIKNEYLFKIPFEDDAEEILSSYIDGWNPLIQFMHEHDVLINFIKKLHNVCFKSYDCKARKLSSLWLNEIFGALLEDVGISKDFILKKAKITKNGCFCAMNLHGTTERFLVELNEFTEEAIEVPHMYFRNYSKRLMTLCNYEKHFIEQADDLLLSYFQPSEKLVKGTPMTVEDINNMIQPNILEEIYGESEQMIVEENKKRWQKIENTDIYEGCPIGVLPHQSRDCNPIYSFCS